VKEDCRNDCVEALRFPGKLENRPGLSHIDYRIGTYADLREALLRNLDKTPILSEWTHRGVDDPGIALLEGAAILGDILTFYQERYANEAYLRTAEWRDSISDLVRLLGYRLSPGLGGKASFAFEVKGDQPVAIPANFPLKAEVEGSTKPVEFETSEAAVAYPWLSKFNLFAPLWTPPINASTNEFYIQAPDQFSGDTPVVLKPGDRLLVGEIDPNASFSRLNNPEIVIVDSIRTLQGVKMFKIKGNLKRAAEVGLLSAFKLGRSFHHFGHNGPRTMLKPVDPNSSTVKVNADKSTTVETQLPLEIKLSFFRDLTTNSSSDNLANFITQPPPKAVPLPPVVAGGSGNVGMPITGLNPMGSGFQKMLGGSSGYAASNLPYTFAQLLGLANASTKAVYNGEPVVIADPPLSNTQFPLDAEVQDLAAGVTFVVQGQFYSSKTSNTPVELALMRNVSDIKTTSVTWGLATGTVSLLTMNAALNAATDGNNFLDIRQVQFHETVSPPLTLRAAVQPSVPTIHNALNFLGTFEQAKDLLNRKLFFVKATGTPVSVNVTAVVSLSATDGAHPLLHQITLSDANLDYADFPNEPPFMVTAYGNIVEATQGKTEKLTPLGNGDSRLVFQTFKLPKSPLTYFRSGSSSPPEVPEVQIYVDNRLWKGVASFFGRQPDEEIYIVREDPDNFSWVQFGDGKTGARLPSGIKNVSAVYRSGTGAFGALKEKAKVQAGAKLDRLDKIQMPQAAADGAQPEDGENARAAAPGKIQSLDRLVSLEDFESEALGTPGITKAAATWELIGEIPRVTLTVLMETGRQETVAGLSATFARSNSDRGPNRFPIQPILGQLKCVGLMATFGYDSTYLEADVRAEILKALGVSSGAVNAIDDPTGLFSLRRRNFGQKEYATTVMGVIQQVAGVVWATVEKFEAPITLLPGTTLAGGPVLNNLAVIDCPNDCVLTLQSGHVVLLSEKVIVTEARP
jgi:predicted phage baseplate assembly protein